MKLLRFSNGVYINPALVREWRVGRGFSMSWFIKANEFIVRAGIETEAAAQEALSTILHDLGTTILLPDED